MRIRAKRFLLGIILVILCAVGSHGADAAEWSIYVYVNGKNNLEGEAIADFLEMSKVEDSPNVNIVVQMGRPINHYDESYGAWSGVRRFNVKKGMTPEADAAIQDVGSIGESTDMGSPETLENFLTWGLQQYPAKRSMLIIWNHGQGWRFQLAGNRIVRQVASAKSITAEKNGDVLASTPASRVIGGYRSVSSDDDTGNILFNSDIADVLNRKFSKDKLNVLGFDACLMAMTETGYAFRASSELMIGSEELEPGAGWAYDKWLPSLTQNPSMNGKELAKAIVDSYQNHYGKNGLTTLSTIDLSQINTVANTLTLLGDKMSEKLATERSAIKAARAGIRTYGDIPPYKLVTSIDLDFFLERYRAGTKNQEIIALIDPVRKALKNAIIYNYASDPSTRQFGSKGLAIYFPATKANFLKDPDSGGYYKNNVAHPVEFVRDHRWADFLSVYLQ